MAQGHADAWSYPLGLVLLEAQLVIERLNAEKATNATILRMAVSTIPNMNVKPSDTKKLGESFRELIAKLLPGD